jgi:hypothetical protein
MVTDTKKDSSLTTVARLLQEYALEHGIRPSEIDMYFLIQEQQSDASTWVKKDFEPVYDVAKLPPAVALPLPVTQVFDLAV